MRGELCVGSASLLSIVSLILLIFLHVGQINESSSVTRGIYMAHVNTSGYGAALAAALAPDPIEGLYATNASAPLAARAGLRAEYRFGLYGYCALENGTGAGACANTSGGAPYKPYDAFTADLAANYSLILDSMLPAAGLGFRASGTLGAYTTAAYYLILLASIACALAFLFGLFTRTYTFLLSTIFAVLGAVMLLIAGAMWTAMVEKSEDVNKFVVPAQGHTVPLGIAVGAGPGLYLLWAAFATLAASTLPYLISCCTYRG